MDSGKEKRYWETKDGGCSHLVSWENTDRLKHETAFHNPGNMNPNEILNLILDEYFAFAEQIRR